MLDWYLKVLRQYADFGGRARRSEYWYFTLVNLLISIPLQLAARLTEGGLSLAFAIVYAAYVLAIFVPALAVSIRRLHDVGRSGWWYFLIFIPLVGAIVLLVWCCEDSGPDNEWGPNPKAESLTSG